MSSLKSIIRKRTPQLLGAYHFLLAWSAAKFARHPSQKIFVIGVTGTKGKTTTLELINAILVAAGKKTALLSSLRVKIGDDTSKNQSGNSMPGRGYIQGFLRRAANAGCGYALIEVTSQGVVAHRHRFVDWNIGVLTNLHPEHIESHGSFENYRAAKLVFLKDVMRRGGKIFLNSDDPNFPFFDDALMSAKTEAFSMSSDVLRHYLPKPSAVRMAAGAELPNAAKFLLSDFNKSNIACAVAVTKELGISDPVIQKAIEEFEGVPGRANMVNVGDYTAVVDYAHTPESLEAIYKTVKPKKEGARLLCVLGAAGGGRDIWKRVEFGKIAEKYCDELFLTEEDPYDEKPEKIISDIRSGITNHALSEPNIHEIPDRRDAIAAAVRIMRPGDVVVGTGKGSEDWIHNARGKRRPWNEKDEFERALMAKTNPGSGAAQVGTSPLDLPWV